MKLYELNRGDSFKLLEDPSIPPDAPEGEQEAEYSFQKVDGMYASVSDRNQGRYYFAAWTEVERVENRG